MPSELTPKQEKFCQAYIETGNASEAYRCAYNAGRMKSETVNRKAKALLDHGKITARIEELQADHAERHACTIDDIARQLDEDREFARECGNASAAVAATMGKARLFGHLVEKRESSAKINIQANPLDGMSFEERRNMLADRLKAAAVRVEQRLLTAQ